jgi:hypothetical protein
LANFAASAASWERSCPVVNDASCRATSFAIRAARLALPALAVTSTKFVVGSTLTETAPRTLAREIPNARAAAPTTAGRSTTAACSADNTPGSCGATVVPRSAKSELSSRTTNAAIDEYVGFFADDNAKTPTAKTNITTTINHRFARKTRT